MVANRWAIALVWERPTVPTRKQVLARFREGCLRRVSVGTIPLPIARAVPGLRQRDAAPPNHPAVSTIRHAATAGGWLQCRQ